MTATEVADTLAMALRSAEGDLLTTLHASRLPCYEAKGSKKLWEKEVRAMNDALSNLDATAQAELVRRGDAKPVELVQATIDRIERLNPKLNAVIHPANSIISGQCLN